MENTKETVAYYFVPKDGGFQLRGVYIEDGLVLDDKAVGSPDAWNEVMSELEFELGKKFQ